MTVKYIIAIIATIIAVVGNIPYLLDVIKRRVQPHPYTWLVWAFVSGIVLFGQITKGAGIGALPVVAAEVFTIVIFLFSLRYGFKYIKKIDTYFLIIALLGIIPWIITKDPTISIIIAVLIDLTAFIPTLRKTWKNPETEDLILYSMNVVRHILIMFSLEAYNIATILHSLVMIVVNSVMTMIISFHKNKKPNI